jgi:hypothetical protein
MKARLAASIVLAIVTITELVLAIMLLLECIDLLSEDPSFRPKFDFLWWHTTPSTDVIIILLAMSAGVTGSFILAASSYVKYHGNKTLVLSWIPWYLARAPIGAALAIIMYLVIRAGLIPTTTASEQVSPLGVAALAGLAGMFSNRAVDQLERIFTAAFGKDPEQEDPLVPKGPTVTSTSFIIRDGRRRLVVQGTNLDDSPRIVIAGESHVPDHVSADRLELDVEPLIAAVATVPPPKVSVTTEVGSVDIQLPAIPPLG